MPIDFPNSPALNETFTSGDRTWIYVGSSIWESVASSAIAKATSTALGTIELFSDTVQSTAANATTTTASRTYGIQLNSADQAVVNVPWTDTVYSLPNATSTVLGGIELFSDTVQTVASNSVTTTASRTYGLQLNASGQAVVNVPWTDSVPSQATHAGKLLTTNGTTASWSDTLATAGANIGLRLTNSYQTDAANIYLEDKTLFIRQNLQGLTGGISLVAGTQERVFIDGVSGLTTFKNGISATNAEPTLNTNTASSVGYVGMPQGAATTGALTLARGHAGEHIYSTASRLITIPGNATGTSPVPFEIGTTIVLIAGAGATVTISMQGGASPTTDTLILAGTGTSVTGANPTSPVRTLAPFGMATLVKVTATSWFISGNGLT